MQKSHALAVFREQQRGEDAWEERVTKADNSFQVCNLIICA